MLHKKRIRFIVNPFSGLGKQKTFKALAAQELDKSIWSWEVVFTKYPGHATLLSAEAAGHFDIVVAVGGDGTVNEVGSGLIGTDLIMGIIPAGSGNGLARHLNIPLKVNRALQMFNQYNVQPIDAIRFHNKYSLNVSGVGFDGHISHLFAHAKQRGPMGYLRLITTEFSKYKSKNYRLVIDGVPYENEANLELGFKMDERDYGVGAQILRDLGVTKMRLLSNNPKKRTGLIGYGLEIVENVPIEIAANEHNRQYLTTKRDKLGHEIMKPQG